MALDLGMSAPAPSTFLSSKALSYESNQTYKKRSFLKDGYKLRVINDGTRHVNEMIFWKRTPYSAFLAKRTARFLFSPRKGFMEKGEPTSQLNWHKSCVCHCHFGSCAQVHLTPTVAIFEKHKYTNLCTVEK
jgi:hypothetical protein